MVHWTEILEGLLLLSWDETKKENSQKKVRNGWVIVQSCHGAGVVPAKYRWWMDCIVDGVHRINRFILLNAGNAVD